MKETIRGKKKDGYNVNAGKSYLIVKDKYEDKAIEVFKKNLNITTEGNRQCLGCCEQNI